MVIMLKESEMGNKKLSECELSESVAVLVGHMLLFLISINTASSPV